MKRQGILVLAVLMACAAAQAQPYWKRLGRGTVGPTQFHALYGDSVSDRLLAGGSFLYLMNETDTILGVGQAAWNGHRWDSLATRVQPISGGSAQPTYWFMRQQGDLYISGSFPLEYEAGQYTSWFARLNETTQRWEHLHCPIAGWSRITQLVPRAVPGQWLYATGHRDTICGLPQRAAFRYNGEQFVDWPPFAALSDDHSDYVGHVFEYQGMVHATGVLYHMFGSSIACFIRYNCTAWEPVPGWPLCPGPIKDIHIQGDTLYVCGAFTMSQGAPGNLIACYDGNAWHNMGGGLRYTVVPNGEVALTMHRWRGDLYVGGVFDRAGDVPTMGLAVWKGNRWCTLPGEFQNNIGSDYFTVYQITTWRDSLFMIGSFATIDGEPIRQVAQWIGGDALGDCSAPVGVAEQASVQRISVAPNPTTGVLELLHLPNEAARIELLDGLGRKVYSQSALARTLQLDALPNGHYHVVVLDRRGQPLARAPVAKH